MLYAMTMPAKTTVRTLFACVALSLASGCANLDTTSPQADATLGPELAGAWYQVYFETDGSQLNQRGRRIVDTVAQVVAANGGARVTVIGKTDRVGGPTANLALSERRADAVRDALITAGVAAGRIDTSWTGEGRQRVGTADDIVEQRNRVVDITVVLPSSQQSARAKPPA